MAKRTLWQWMFGLMATTRNSSQSHKLSKEELSRLADSQIQQDYDRVRRQLGIDEREQKHQAKQLTEDEWNERCSGGAQVIINRTGQQQSDEYELRDLAKQHTGGMHGQGNPARTDPAYTWRPGIEHTQPHPVKENEDGTLYYKGKVYRMIGERRKNKRR